MTRATNQQNSRKRRRPSLDECMDKLSLATLEANFHLPLREAADKFGVCVTFFKKVCRAHGISRWPHRKVAQIHKNLEKMGEAPSSLTVEGLEEIKRQEEENANGPRRRIPIWDKVKKRKLSGMAAPLEHNLPLYLCEHPDYEVYEGQDRVISSRNTRPRKQVKREPSEFEELDDQLVLDPVLPPQGTWEAPTSKRPGSPTSQGSSDTTMSASSRGDSPAETPFAAVSLVRAEPAAISGVQLLWPDEMQVEGSQQGSAPAQSSAQPDAMAELGLDAIEDKDFIQFVDSIELDSWTVPEQQQPVVTVTPQLAQQPAAQHRSSEPGFFDALCTSSIPQSYSAAPWMPAC